MKQLLLTVLFALALNSCSWGDAPPASTAQPTLEPFPSPSPTVLPSATLSPTATNTPTLTPSPTLVPSLTSSRSTFPLPGVYTWSLIAFGLARPVGLSHAGDGTGRLFILEQAGTVRIFKNGQLSPEPFLDIRDRVGSTSNEQGLLGLAFHPAYTENGYFYVNYTDLGGDTVIARFQTTAGEPDRADPATEFRLLYVPQPFPNHNGGMVAFGRDGMLYLGLGDGGSGGDPQNNGQSLNTLLGKILRLDVDHGEPFAIPPDNPFAAGGGRKEIWAYGLRNPWRFSFDRVTGDLYIGDVGQGQWEEIDFLPYGAPGGSNFGWNIFEGFHPYRNSIAPAGELVPPIFEYGHEQGCSVTGGVVYRGSLLPEWQGIYLFGDYCSGRVWGLLMDSQQVWQSLLLFELPVRIASFGEDEAGEVYLVDHTGNILKLVAQ